MMVQISRSLLFRGFLAIFFLFLQANSSRSEEEMENDDFDDELYSVIHSVRDGSLWSNSRKIRSIDVNRTIDHETFTDNSLWNDLWHECRRKASFSCIRTGVFKYLDKSLDRPGNFSLTDSLFFRSNKNKVNGFCENSDEGKEKCLRYNMEKSKVVGADDAEPEKKKVQEKSEDRKNVTVNENHETFKEKNSTETVKKTSKDKEGEENVGNKSSVNSLAELSDILYDKGTHFLMTHDTEFQLPELFFGGGSIKIEPKSYIEESETEEEGALVKIVFKPPQQTKEVGRGRILGHLKKLFKKKLMHSFMALMLIIKMIKVKLMFLLPMIIGKATAKKLLLKVLLFLIPGLSHLFKLCHYYHMEHAKYHHHHHKIKHHHHHVQVPVPVPVPIHVDSHNNIEGPIYEKPSAEGYDYPPYPPHSSHPPHQPSGPDTDYDYGGSQGGYDYGSVSQYHKNEAQLSSWGLGSSNYHEAGVLDAKNQPQYYKNHPYGGYYYPEQAGSHSQRYGTKLQLLTPKPPQEGPPISLAYDPFYSPILQKIDKIFVQLGFNDEGCRERLICSMYKTPHRFSPHSNLLSHELSRDSLQKPTMSNTAVLRFYRYVQAARDGQDRKNCLQLYPSCSINTE